LESTVPVGTTDKLLAKYSKLNINIAFCPERVLPGNVMSELINNDRIIGGLSVLCAQRAKELYSVFSQGRFHETDLKTAELVKLSENAFRDVNIAFANELSLVCEKLNINVWELIKLTNNHPRVNILQPGPGVGGHCIAVDPWFIIHGAPEQTKIMKTAREVNDNKPIHIINKILKISQQFESPKIACLGVSFKADIDDLRESPSLKIIESLSKKEFLSLYIVEPHIQQLPTSLGNHNIELCDLERALQNADIILLLTDHSEFKKINLGMLEGKKVIDTRGIWDVSVVEQTPKTRSIYEKRKKTEINSNLELFVE
jgi:UDP-N-acetyl-D-mannosaminuronic acid dehydrogenase